MAMMLLDPLAECTSYIRAAALEPYLIERGGSFILKPQNGPFGRGVFLLEVRDGALVRRRGTETTPFRLGGRREVLLIERARAAGRVLAESLPRELEHDSRPDDVGTW